jgi:hypothetical protein
MNHISNPPTFTLARIAEEFDRAGENLPADLSAVTISAIRDVHYDDDVEITVEVFGRDGTAGPPMVSERVSFDGPLNPAAIAALFDTDTRMMMAVQGIAIGWNPEWESRAEIDPLSQDCMAILAPEAQ